MKEISINEAKEICNKHKCVLMAIQDLQKENIDISFTKKRSNEYDEIFQDVKKAFYIKDDFLSQISLFTEQTIHMGLKKIIMIGNN